MLPGEKHKGKAVGIMDSLFCFGMIAGPPIGGVLYKYGGFYFPFVVIGGTMVMCSIVSLIILKTSMKSGKSHYEATKLSRTKFSTLLKIPQVSTLRAKKIAS